MKHHLLLSIKTGLYLSLLIFIFSSCVPQKKIIYLQKQLEHDTSVFYNNTHNIDYKIQPKDNLYIRVFSLDEKAFLFFNKQSGTNSYNDYANDASIYLNSYSVTTEGTIDFPIIGKVIVRDLTVDQVKSMIQQLINEYLKETTVVVKMVNFKITLVGEVNRPGEFTIYKDDINIFEALSLAGDMTEFANRNRVALIRLTKGGSKVNYLDLTSDKILKSDYYYLQPNDIIYVIPLGYKRWGFGTTFPWAIVLTSISTALLLINYFNK
ncbi:MAG: polysaccharide biosynthesis/export family protein [Bacteroidales bacterium]|nr:polysaccharide biosynthesis/export family protein [Bacteroidales bacterium]MDD4602743.1 polysaccharide biosynthesis/export family protein [Bacteroidales bacterium]